MSKWTIWLLVAFSIMAFVLWVMFNSARNFTVTEELIKKWTLDGNIESNVKKIAIDNTKLTTISKTVPLKQFYEKESKNSANINTIVNTSSSGSWIKNNSGWTLNTPPTSSNTINSLSGWVANSGSAVVNNTSSSGGLIQNNTINSGSQNNTLTWVNR